MEPFLTAKRSVVLCIEGANSYYWSFKALKRRSTISCLGRECWPICASEMSCTSFSLACASMTMLDMYVLHFGETLMDDYGAVHRWRVELGGAMMQR